MTRLPGLPSDWSGKHYAGMIDSDDASGGRLFYWFFERDGASPVGDLGGDGSPTPLVIWLNGGPGCSSMDGLFLELGPLRVAAPGTRGGPPRLSRRAHSWHRAANVLFVDQPVGTGFSRTSGRAYCKNDDCIVNQFETFLARFARSYAAHALRPPGPNGQERSVPVYFSGESHAGHYVPVMMEKLLHRATSGISWDVKGAALGNAWIDPAHQYDVSRIARLLGLISPEQAASLQAKEAICQKKLAARAYMFKGCWDLLDDAVRITRQNGGGLGVNQYDARDNVKSSRFFPPGHGDVEAYMNRDDVRAALHVDKASQRFKECADPPYDNLQHQDGLGVVPSLQRLLDGPAHKRVRFLFYNGQTDLICNHVGVQRSLEKLDWTGKRAFADAKTSPWLRRGHVAGFHREAHNLALLAIRDSGHMVPLDQPEVALDMIATFLDQRPFDAPRGQPAACADTCPRRHHHGGRP